MFFNSSHNNPLISIVVVMYNMERESKRSLYSLSTIYQIDVKDDDYEVIVIDNGSDIPLGEEFVRSFGPNFRYFHLKTPSSSPCHAINFGASKARGKFLGIMIDGARILTPGIIKYALAALAQSTNPIVAIHNLELGHETQSLAMLKNYNKAEEDRNLVKIDWPKNPYKLFDISCLSNTSGDGWLLQIKESNLLFVEKGTFKHLNGYNEKFVKPGGGSANIDFYIRACGTEDSQLYFVLGEGSFHQYHNGSVSNITPENQKRMVAECRAEYKSINGIDQVVSVKTFAGNYNNKSDSKEWDKKKRINYIGHFPPEFIRFFMFSLEKAKAVVES